MRHNDARKWLHAGLDLLPVLLIPVFMIYSHRHSLTERIQVDIQYKYQSNEVNSLDDLVLGNVYHLSTIDFTETPINYFVINLLHFEISNEDIDDFWADDYFFDNYSADDNNYIVLAFNDDSIQMSLSNRSGYVLTSFIINDLTLVNIDFFISTDSSLSYFKQYVQQYGNEVTISNFNVIESVDVQDTNSDIMSVFIDDFNGAIDNYFNMGNVFNLNGVYQWFNTNIFNGNAPQIIYSVWNIALYELIMDLLFLLYGLFMWFIDMCKHLMEKPFRSIK